MTLMDYINSCNANLKIGRKDRAKKCFELSWDLYKKRIATDEEEKYLFILRENFYPVKAYAYCGEYGDFLEGKILEKNEIYD